MARVFRVPESPNLFLELGDHFERNPREIADELHKSIISYLAEEFLKKYKDGILGALNADDIAYKLNDAVTELVRRKLLEGTNESAT